MVRAGLAHWYRRYAPKDAELERLESEARAAKRGLWQEDAPVKPELFRMRSKGKKAVPVM